MTIYDSHSPYYGTPQITKELTYLDFWKSITLQPSTTDLLLTLNANYQYRPDRLSYDLYQTPKLWWIFIIRNPDIIRDPIWDFVAGIQIYAPSKPTVAGYL